MLDVKEGRQLVEVHDQSPNLNTYIIAFYLVGTSVNFVKDKPS